MDQGPRMRRGDDWYTPDSAVGCFVWLAAAIIIWVIIGIWWRPYWWPWWGSGNPNAQRGAPTQPYGGGPGPQYQQPYPNRAYPNQGGPNQPYPYMNPPPPNPPPPNPPPPSQPPPGGGNPNPGSPQPAQP